MIYKRRYIFFNFSFRCLYGTRKIIFISGQEEVRRQTLSADDIGNQTQLCFSLDQTLQQQMNIKDFTTEDIRPVRRHIQYQDQIQTNHRQRTSETTFFKI